MTTIIDHAINIPSPTQVVWALVSNPEQFPRWQSDCQRIAFLTTQRRGKNTRLRCMSDSGKEYVMEISAWYEGLGYEYKIIDGGPYETNQGRIRLQEIAEGTVVQWTFSYSLAGVLGSLRNMGVRRSAENQVIDSLRNLYRFVRDSAGENNIKVIKSLMQDAPDVDQRATYQPRHPTQYDEERIRQSGGTARPVPVQRTTMRPIIDEPLPADDDTQRNRPVTPPAAEPTVEAPRVRPPTNPNAPFARPITEPESPFTRPPSEAARPPIEPRRDYSTTIPPVTERPDTAFAPKPDPRPVPTSGEPPRPVTPAVPAARIDVDPMTTPPPIPEVRAPSPAFPPTIMSRPGSTPLPPDAPVRSSSTSLPPVPLDPLVRSTSTSLPPVPAESPVRTTSTSLPPVPEKAPITTDTGRMSVFELFGLPKPSETQQMKAVDLPPAIRPETPSTTTPRVENMATPLSTVPTPPLNDVSSAEMQAAREAFQAGMPQTGDLTPEPIRQGWRALHRRQMLSLRRPTKPQ